MDSGVVFYTQVDPTRRRMECVVELIVNGEVQWSIPGVGVEWNVSTQTMDVHTAGGRRKMKLPKGLVEVRTTWRES